MQCPACGAIVSDTASFCEKCGHKFLVEKPSGTPKYHLWQCLALMVCCVCLGKSLFSLLFLPIWELPAFGKYSGAAEELKDAIEEAGYALEDIKHNYQVEYDSLSRSERAEMRKFFDAADEFLNSPTLLRMLDLCSNYEDQLGGAKQGVENLKKQVFYAAVLFVAAAASLFCLARSIKESKSPRLSLLIAPVLFSYCYDGIAMVAVVVIAGVIILCAKRIA